MIQHIRRACASLMPMYADEDILSSTLWLPARRASNLLHAMRLSSLVKSHGITRHGPGVRSSEAF
jgi:hypothetical protein